MQSHLAPSPAAHLDWSYKNIATDFPHEPRAEFRENIERFIAREDICAETKHKLMFENPKRMYPLALP